MITGIKKLLFLLPFIFIETLICNPTGAETIKGNVSIAANNKDLHISASDKAIIHWQDFSVKKTELTRFIQPSAKATVLNRVVGNNMSNILGRLEANGHVFLINQSGIFIGKDAVVDTAAFTASALNLSDEDFLKNSQLLFESLSKANVINYGTINAWDGDVTLLGYKIENHGQITSPKGNASLAIGQTILLKPEAEEKIFIRPEKSEIEEKEETGIINTGNISAIQAELKADGNPYVYAINHSGKIQAYAVEKKGGKVFIVAEDSRAITTGEIIAKKEDAGGEVRILAKEIGLFEDAKVDVSAEKGDGIVLIGGDYHGKNPEIYNAKAVFVSPDSIIDASALDEGNGGKIIVWGNEVNRFYGLAKAKGGEKSGDGGFVEISAKELDYVGKIDLTATNGTTGKLLLDPYNITITGANLNINQPAPPSTWTPTGSPSTINVTTLIGGGGLAGGNIEISTFNPGGAEAGDITVSSAVNWSANTLKLNAEHDVIVNANLQTNGGNIELVAVNDITVAATLNSNTGYISMQATNGISINTGNLVNVAGSGNLTMQATNSNISVLGSITTFNGSVSITATNGEVDVGDGIVNGGSINITGAGNLNITTLNAATGHLKVEAGSAATAYCQTVSGTITCNIAGDVDITGGGASFVPAEIKTSGGGAINISAGNDLTLQGGVAGGTSNSHASIETTGVGGNITLDAGNDIEIFGGAGNSGNSAYVTSNNADVIMGSVTLPQEIKLHAGAGTIGTHAYILANNNCSLNLTTGVLPVGTLSIDASTGAASSHAYIAVTNGNFNLNASDLQIIGGNAAGGNNYAYIQVQTGNFTYDVEGVNKGRLLLQGGTNNSSNNARINVQNGTATTTIKLHEVGNTGDISLTCPGSATAYISAPTPTIHCDNLSLTAGSSSSAYIHAITGTLDIDTDNNITLTGGVGNAVARLYPTNATQAIKINALGNLTLTAGTGAIGELPSARIDGFNDADINVGGSITLTASPAADVSIGSAYLLFANLAADIRANDVHIIGGDSTGFGAEAKIEVGSGDLNIQASGANGIVLDAGNGNTFNYAYLKSPAAINLNPIGKLDINGNEAKAYVQCGAGGGININCTGNMTLQGGYGNGAHAEIIAFSGVADLSISVGGNLSILGGDAPFPLPAANPRPDAYITNIDNADITVVGQLLLQGGNDLYGGSAYINFNQTNPVGGAVRAGNIKVQGGDSITGAPGAAYAIIYSTNNLLLATTAAGTGLEILTSNQPNAYSINQAYISSGFGDITIYQATGGVTISAPGNAANGGAEAYMTAQNISMGTTTPIDSFSLSAGADSLGNTRAYINTTGSFSVAANTANNFVITGGTNHQSNYAEIVCGTSFQTTGAGIGDVLITSNTGYAHLDTGTTLNMTADSLIMQAGNNVTAHARVYCTGAGFPNCSITTTNNVELLGALGGTADAFIDRYTLNAMTVGGLLKLEGGNGGAVGRAYINVDDVLTNITANRVQILAGNTAAANCEAYIYSNGNLTLITTGGDIDIIGGAGHINNAAGLSNAAVMTVNSFDDIYVTGQVGPASISSGNGAASFTTGGDINITGGSTTNGNAYITTFFGFQPLTLNLTGDLLINAGTGIAGQNIDAYIANYNNASVSVGGDIILTGSPGPSGGRAYIVLDSLLGVTNISANKLEIYGGDSINSFADSFFEITNGPFRLNTVADAIVNAATAVGASNLNNAYIKAPSIIMTLGNELRLGSAPLPALQTQARSYIECTSSTGAVNINSAASIVLRAGINDSAHSQIIFSPGPGYPDLTLVAGGNLTLEGGYTAVGTVPEASISTFKNAEITVTGNITLQGSNDLINNGGPAYIVLDNTTTNGISATNIYIYGGNALNSGAVAQIYSGSNGDLYMNASNSLIVRGGTGHINNYAFIHSDLDLWINGPGLVQILAQSGASAYVEADNVNLGTSTSINGLTITGGSGALSQAYLQSTVGDVTIGTSTGPLTITSGTVNINNSARIFAQNAFITTGNIQSLGIQAQDAIAEIQTGGAFTYLGGVVNITGGNVPNAFARIFATAGFPIFNAVVSGFFRIYAGTQEDAYIDNYEIGTLDVGNTLRLLGGSGAVGAQAYIQTNNVIGFIRGQAIEVIGGATPIGGSGAYINSANRLSLITTTTDFQILGGNVNNTNAATVYGDPVIVNVANDVKVTANVANAALYAGTSGLTFTAANNLEIQGGTNNTSAEVASAGGPCTLTMNIGNDLLITAGNVAAPGNIPNAYLRDFTDANITVGNDIILTASTTVLPATDCRGQAIFRITTLAAGSYISCNSLSVLGGTSADTNAYAQFEIQSGALRLLAPGGITVYAGVSNNNNAIITANGDMTFGQTANPTGHIRVEGRTGNARIEGTLATTFMTFDSTSLDILGGNNDWGYAQISGIAGPPHPTLVMNISGNVNITGGSTPGIVLPYATITQFDNVDMNIGGALTLTGDSTPLVNGASATISIDKTDPAGSISASSISVLGGGSTGSGALAGIYAGSGDLSIETTGGAILVQAASAHPSNTAVIEATSGILNFLRGGNLTIQAQAGAPAYCRADSVQIGSVAPISGVSILGGSHPILNSVAYIETITGNLTVGNISGALSIFGGSASTSNYARIFIPAGSFITTGSIGNMSIAGNTGPGYIETWNNFSYNGGSCTIAGGASPSAHARIYTSNPANPNFSWVSSLGLRLVGGTSGANAAIENYTVTNMNLAGQIVLQSSNTSSGDAYMDIRNVTGVIQASDIWVRTGVSPVAGANSYILSHQNLNLQSNSTDITIRGSNNLNTNTANLIASGVLNLNAARDVIILSQLAQAAITGNSINITANGDVNLTGGTDPAGLAAASIAAAAGSITINAANVNMIAGTNNASNSANLSTTANVTMNVGNDIYLLGNSVAPARIFSAGGDYFLEAGNEFIMEGYCDIILPIGGNDYRILAGNNMRLIDNAAGSPILQNQSLAGPLYLVVDNNYPAFPFLGTGYFHKDPNVTISTGGGPLYIYTSRQPLNSISGLINGVAYVPGPEFVNSLTEEWFHYYPLSPGGFPFTIYYKDFREEFIILHEGIVQGFTALTEASRMLHEYSEFIRTATEFKIQYGKGPYLKVKNRDLYEIPLEDRYYFLRKRTEPNEVKITEDDN